MAAKAISEINQNVLLCSVCHERFQTPKTLACQHSFCLTCIQKWVNKSKGVLTCPMCRRKCNIPQAGLAELPSSYFINQLLEYTKQAEGTQEDSNCAMCHTNSTTYCMQCLAYLCKRCADNHCKMMLPCRGHTVVPLEQYRSMDVKKRAAAKPVMCPQHIDAAVEFYCVGCSSPVCYKCTVVNHKGHNLQELKTAFESFIKDAKKVLSHCSTEETNMKASLKQHLKDTEAEKQSVIKCVQEVNQHAEKLHQMVDNAKKKLLANLTKRSDLQLKNRNKKKITKEEKIAQLQNVSVTIDSLINAPQPTAALFDGRPILKEAKKMTEEQPVQQQQLAYAYHAYQRQDEHAARVDGNSSLFNFQENKQLTHMFSQSIGSIQNHIEGYDHGYYDHGYDYGVERGYIE